MYAYYIYIIIVVYANNKSSFVAVLGHQSPPQGLMPNEDMDSTPLDSREKYRSYTRYVSAAEEAERKDVWWKTYRKHREEEQKDGKSSWIHTHSELTFTRATLSVLIGFVDSRRAGQHRAPVSLPLQEDGAEGEEEGDAGEQKEPRDGKRRSTTNT